MYDGVLEEFRAVVKTFLIIGNRKRRSVMRTQSPDGFSWDLPHPAVIPDPEDDEWAEGRDGYQTEFYGMPIFRYESMLLGLLQVYKCTGSLMDGTTDVQLVSSRDGRSWQRVGDRRPILERGAEEGEWDWGIAQTGNSLIPDGDVVRAYYFGSRLRHGQTEKNCRAIGMAWWPRDRLVGLRAGAGGGEVHVRQPVPYGEVHVNADAARGSLVAEIRDADGRPVQGFEAVDCVPLAGDSLDHAFCWRGDPTLALDEKRPVSVVLKLTDAELFSLWWE